MDSIQGTCKIFNLSSIYFLVYIFLYTYSAETVQNHLYKTCLSVICKLSYNLLNTVKKVQKQDGFMCPGDRGRIFEPIGFEYKTQWTNTDCNTVHGEAQVGYSCEDMAASDMWLTATTQDSYTRYRLGKHQSSNLKGIFLSIKPLSNYHKWGTVCPELFVAGIIISPGIFFILLHNSFALPGVLPCSTCSIWFACF